MMIEIVRDAFLSALELTGIDLRYHDPFSDISWDLRAIPQDTEWEGLGFQMADSGRVRAWLMLRDALPMLPEQGHLVSELSPAMATTERLGLLRAQTYVLAPLTGDRVYDILPEGVLMRITGKLREDIPLE